MRSLPQQPGSKAKTRIKAISECHAMISYIGDEGDEVEIDLYAPRNGGYVHDEHAHQICERFRQLGPTMLWGGPDREPFVEFVRRHWHAGRRDEREAPKC